jgi:hypothetical protein
MDQQQHHQKLPLIGPMPSLQILWDGSSGLQTSSCRGTGLSVIWNMMALESLTKQEEIRLGSQRVLCFNRAKVKVMIWIDKSGKFFGRNKVVL